MKLHHDHQNPIYAILSGLLFLALIAPVLDFLAFAFFNAI